MELFRQFVVILSMPGNIYDSRKSFQMASKGFILAGVLIIAFIAVNLILFFQGKRESAYSVLTKQKQQQKEKLMLQDTRVHNWSEVNNKAKYKTPPFKSTISGSRP